MHHEQLREVEQLRDVVFVLIADQLAAGLLQALGRPLVLDHEERDAVHEADDIAALGLRAGGALDREFGRDVIRRCSRDSPNRCSGTSSSCCRPRSSW